MCNSSCNIKSKFIIEKRILTALYTDEYEPIVTWPHTKKPKQNDVKQFRVLINDVWPHLVLLHGPLVLVCVHAEMMLRFLPRIKQNETLVTDKTKNKNNKASVHQQNGLEDIDK